MRDIHYFSGRMGNEMFRHAYLYTQVRECNIPDWYLQDYKYFEKYAEEIKQLFGDGIGYLEQVGVHVRRAANPVNPEEPKYSENPYYAKLGLGYYEKAMAMFPREKFLIFSDDPEWVREYFLDARNPLCKDIQVMNKGNEVEDLNLFASCKGQIIANSSWSWWGAFLSPLPNPKIIAPKQWFTDGIERTICPKEWIRI